MGNFSVDSLSSSWSLLDPLPESLLRSDSPDAAAGLRLLPPESPGA